MPRISQICFIKTIATKVAAIKKNAISREILAPNFSLKNVPERAEEKIAGKVEKLVANPNIKLFMAGVGEIDKVKVLIAEKKLENNIEVMGWVDFAGKLELLKKCATVILPSYNEGLPMSILEGMAAGKAIISTTVGAIPEVVTAENGILLQPGDVMAIADALVACTSDPARLAAMGEKNIQKINDRFSMKSMHEKLAHYFERVQSSWLGV